MKQKIQYEIRVEKNSVNVEQGSFFKALPFYIKIAEKRYDVYFERGQDNHVHYVVKCDNKIIVSLGHPDYVPLCTPEELNAYLDCQDAETLFVALLKVGVSQEKKFSIYLDAVNKHYTYHLIQPIYPNSFS